RLRYRLHAVCPLATEVLLELCCLYMAVLLGHCARYSLVAEAELAFELALQTRKLHALQVQGTSAHKLASELTECTAHSVSKTGSSSLCQSGAAADSVAQEEDHRSRKRGGLSEKELPKVEEAIEHGTNYKYMTMEQEKVEERIRLLRQLEQVREDKKQLRDNEAVLSGNDGVTSCGRCHAFTAVQSVTPWRSVCSRRYCCTRFCAMARAATVASLSCPCLSRALATTVPPKTPRPTPRPTPAATSERRWQQTLEASNQLGGSGVTRAAVLPDHAIKQALATLTAPGTLLGWFVHPHAEETDEPSAELYTGIGVLERCSGTGPEGTAFTTGRGGYPCTLVDGNGAPITKTGFRTVVIATSTQRLNMSWLEKLQHVAHWDLPGRLWKWRGGDPYGNKDVELGVLREHAFFLSFRCATGDITPPSRLVDSVVLSNFRGHLLYKVNSGFAAAATLQQQTDLSSFRQHYNSGIATGTHQDQQQQQQQERHHRRPPTQIPSGHLVQSKMCAKLIERILEDPAYTAFFGALLKAPFTKAGVVKMPSGVTVVDPKFRGEEREAAFVIRKCWFDLRDVILSDMQDNLVQQQVLDMHCALPSLLAIDIKRVLATIRCTG
ncbi:hypothetical protein JKP88DRAFT_253540, partial [Tribonema minus]